MLSYRPRVLPWGLAAQAAATAMQTTAARSAAHRFGVFQLTRFRMRLLVSPSPKARGMPAILRRPVARRSREVE